MPTTSSPRLLFAGTPGFALASLEALVQAGLAPVLVLTQPDRPAGRGRKAAQSPVKRYAEAEGLPLLQPETLKSPAVVSRLSALRSDAMVVAAYGLILPPAILELPRAGCINVHASLLPRWRGAAPIQAAILNGDPETGISLMRMDEGLDTGPVYARESLAIDDADTAGTLDERLADLGGDLLVRHLPRILDGSLEPLSQDESLRSYAGKFDRGAARLDWQLPALELARAVRAYNPHPGAWFPLDVDGQDSIKCWAARPLAPVANAPRGSRARRAPAGTVLAAGRDGIDVACGEGTLRLLKLQRPGRGRVTAFELARQLPLAGARLPV
ncbi:MAG TPA: methionyl-tRNA formyltransferase [Woeseiaceae bacterium]|nr:methionyl-tRNA formyltransferase [Woeseiaceae bacterium]